VATDDGTLPADGAVLFGPFRLLARQRLLIEAGVPVHVGSRAIDLLIALVTRPGELLTKDELLAHAWPSTHVVEGNLKFQIAALRRALRDGKDGRRYIATSPGQGYRFVGEVAVEAAGGETGPPPCATVAAHNLPTRLTPIVGRDDVIEKVASRVPSRRLITIVGPGGIGKTTVAMAVAERQIGANSGGVWCADLGRVTDPASMYAAIAAAVRVSLDPEDPQGGIVAALASAQMLLVLDNCAHVIDAAASAVVAILHDCPGVHILATSREPLRVEGEHLVRLASLAAPESSDAIDAAAAMAFPAVRLFVDRATESDETFAVTDAEAPVIAEICRKLDGIPLAIELAAARVGLLGAKEIAARLEEGLQVLKGGRRSTLPRHRTMQAAIEWSYGLLPEAERVTLVRLAVFAGHFTLEAAAAVLADSEHDGDDVADLVLELAMKSLVTSEGHVPETRFRLLSTTRTYALALARERGELDRLARRHAAFVLGLFEEPSGDDTDPDRLAGLEPELNNLTAALEWAFGAAGDPVLGVRLVAASAPPFLSRSRLAEWHGWAERSLALLDLTSLRGTRQEMMLQAALGISFQLVRNRAAEAHAALTRALEIAADLGDAAWRLRILHSLWVYRMRSDDIASALALAGEAEPVAAAIGTSFAFATAESMAAIALHWAGEHRTARRKLESVLGALDHEARARFIASAGYDLRVVARYVLARIDWFEGYPERAIAGVEEATADARRLQNPQSLCSVLAFGGCALAIQTGDLDRAEALAAELVETARRYTLEDFRSWGQAMTDVLALLGRESRPGPIQVRLAVRHWRSAAWHILLSSGDLAMALVAAGDGEDIAEIVEEELARAETMQLLSAVPDLLRAKGELVLTARHPDPATARACFTRALALAREQGALSLELRAALSLAGLACREGRPDAGREELERVFERFTEGFETSDLRRAGRLLAERG
jgi:predicted ATPase/DNA-binding winged helix-turn-helix (wHTH) protein